MIIFLINLDPSDVYLHENLSNSYILVSVHFAESTKVKDFQSKLLED